MHDPSLNNKVLLEARVYNYSVVESAEDIEVRFDIVAINDAEEECTNPLQCLTRRPLGNKVTVQCVNPYGTADQTCNTQTGLPPRGIGVAQYTLDISTLGPQSCVLDTFFHLGGFGLYTQLGPHDTIHFGEVH